jgi:hypothetical protein
MLANILKGATASFVPSETITLVDDDFQSTTNTTTTFIGAGLGPVYPGRRIVVVVGTVAAGTTTGQITSVSVAGISCSELVAANVTSTNTIQIKIYIATVPTGTTGAIVVNVASGGASGSSRIIQVYSLDSVKTSTVTGSDLTSPFTFSRTFAAGDIYLGAGRCVSTATESWTNATEQIATTVSGSSRVSSATSFGAAAGTRTVTFSPSTTGSAAMASVVFV